jgi:hypothetical protein
LAQAHSAGLLNGQPAKMAERFTSLLWDDFVDATIASNRGTAKYPRDLAKGLRGNGSYPETLLLFGMILHRHRPAPLLGILRNSTELTFGQLGPRCKLWSIIRSLKKQGSIGKLDSKIGAAASGAAVLATDRDGTLYNKCYGLADFETLRPITTDTSFYLASISKQFTAMAIMLQAM